MIPKSLFSRQQSINTAAVSPEVNQHDLGVEALCQLRKAESVQQAFLKTAGALQQREALLSCQGLLQLIKAFTGTEIALTKPQCCRRR